MEQLYQQHADIAKDIVMKAQAYNDNYYDGGSSGGFEGDDRTVDVHIRRIRNKIDDHSGIIETVFGIGYRMNK